MLVIDACYEFRLCKRTTNDANGGGVAACCVLCKRILLREVRNMFRMVYSAKRAFVSFGDASLRTL